MIDLIANNNIEKKVLNTLKDSLKKMGFDIIKVRHIDGKESILQIFIDNEDNTVNIDDCGKVSRKASLLLNVEQDFEDSFRLEISSPGIERPLTKLEHLKEFTGHKIFIKTLKKFQKRNRFNCTLVGFNEKELFTEEKDIQRIFKFTDILDIELRPET